MIGAAPDPSRSIVPLALENVGYRAGGEMLIEGINAELAAGPRTVILGPNGAASATA